jgi:hypothetical protein
VSKINHWKNEYERERARRREAESRVQIIQEELNHVKGEKQRSETNIKAM